MLSRREKSLAPAGVPTPDSAVCSLVTIPTAPLYKRVKVKGKAIPLQAWTGPEGSRRLRLPDFKTIGT